MTYLEHVQRVLAKHNARIELGLAKSREQARFVERIGDILYKNHVLYKFNLSDDFDAVFDLLDFSGSLKTLFPHFLVEQDGDEWVVCRPQMPEIQVIVRQGKT